MIYKEQLLSILNDLEKKSDELSEELGVLPAGELHIIRRNGKEYYCERLPKAGNRKKEHRMGITGDDDKTRALVRKKYVKSAIPVINENRKVLEKAIDKYEPYDENSVMNDFVAKHPGLAGYIYPEDSGSWSEDYEKQQSFYADDLTSVAGDGTLMRSRGEVIIAEKLRQYSIPYRYEAPIGIPDIPYIPDFTIRRPKDGRLFYWEHFGDVNDRDYMKRNQQKLSKYGEYGIVPWRNLIITYDTDDGGVNTPLIEGMIQAWLI